ncbi:MAG TPA: hypothetical protein ENJ09_03790 [Planctomycetes bacterium]|nr:hypothetical protein [Planctomycetota bacterium]
MAEKAGTPEKIDLIKLHRAEYAKPKKPVFVDVGPGTYLAVAGKGAPGDALFQDRIAALYAVAYTAKFESKFAGRDFVVCKLEALWGSEEDGEQSSLATLDRAAWPWTMVIRVPDFVTEAELTAARAKLREKGKQGDFDAVELVTLEEGRCVQMLHTGPYEEEGRTLAAMTEVAHAEGLSLHGRHHEIYLSDPRRVPAERLETILRRPVRG